MGITNTAESKSLKANAIMYKFVVVRRRVFLQTEIQTRVFPIRDKMFKVMRKPTSVTIKLKLRELKSSAIMDPEAIILTFNGFHCSRFFFHKALANLFQFGFG